MKSKGVYVVVVHLWAIQLVFGVTTAPAMGIVEATENEEPIVE